MVKKLVPFLPSLLALLTLGAVALTSLPELSVAAKGIGLGAVLASVFVALVPRRAEIRSHGSVCLAAAAMVAAGQAPNDRAFTVMALPFLAAAVATLREPRLAPPVRRAKEEARTGLVARLVPARARGPATLALALAVAITVGLVVSLPPAARWAETRVDEFFQGRLELQHAVGFSDRMRLGSSAKMLASDRVVLRVQGTPPELLKGAVYDVYDGDLWTSSREGERVQVTSALEGPGTARILLARSARVPRGAQARYFVPPGTCRFGTPSGKAAVGNGIPRPATKDDAGELVALARSDASGACEPALASPPPTPADTDVMPPLRKRLAPIADAWLEDHPGASHAEIVQTFAKRLQGFGYSLKVQRRRGLDPVLDLLTVHREGHCEMFAAALVLLARTQGIPARIITGYRVSEVNPISGFAVVRERNAHAWVEAFVDGRWITVDPTPLAEMAAKPKPSFGDELADAFATAFDRAWSSVSKLDPVTLGLGFVALGLAYLGLRRGLEALRNRRGPRAARRASAALSSYDDLERALAGAGLARKSSEPIERFAARVAAGDEGWAAEAAEAIRTYARLSYGGLGEEPAVAAELGALARRIARPN